MKYFDELLSIYQGKDPFTRKFILAQVLDLLPDESTDQIVGLLARESMAGESVVRRQARYVLGQYLSRHGQHLWAMDRVHEGPHDRRDSRPPPGSNESLAARAGGWLAGALGQVWTLAQSGSIPVRLSASLVLGRLWTPAIFDAMAIGMRGDSPGYMQAFSLAEMGTARARDLIVAAAREHGAQRPDLVLLLRGFEGEDVHECLQSLVDRTDAVGRSNIAMALATQEPRLARPIVERLIERREGWVTAYALDTIAGFGEEDDLTLIERAWALESHELVRVQAVRAAGAIASPGAREFCERSLGEGSGRIQAVAIESLARHDLAAGDLARLARPLLASDFVRARVQALLVIARDDPEVVDAPLTEMVISDEPLLRLEGAYVLGFLPTPVSESVLAGMAAGDASPHVRWQAIRSIARFPPARAAAMLADLTRSLDLSTVLGACRALTFLARRDGSVALDALEAAALAAKDAPLRAILLQCIGFVAAASGAREPPPTLVQALTDPSGPVLAGALEGLRMLPDVVAPDLAAALAAHSDPQVCSRAALLGILAGDPGRVSVLQAMLASAQEDSCLAALEALLQLGLALCVGGECPRLARLREALAAGESQRAAPAPAALEIQPAATWSPPAHTVRRTRAAPVLEAALAHAPRSFASAHPGPDVAQRTAVPGRGASGAWKVPAPAARRGLTGPTTVPRPSELPASSRWLDPAQWSSWSRRPRVQGGVAIALAAILLRIVSVAHMPSSDPRVLVQSGPGRGSPLVVFARSGTCRRRGLDTPSSDLHVGDRIAVGDVISCDADGMLQMKDRSGDLVTLFASSHISLAAASAQGRIASRYTFAQLHGHCILDVRQVPRTDVQSADSLLTTSRGVIEVTPAAGGHRFSVTGGEAVVQKKDRIVARLASGEDQVLP